jgi:hypothetical protein
MESNPYTRWSKSLTRYPNYSENAYPNEKNKKSFTIKSSLIYTKPKKSKSTTYVIKKKSNDKVVAHKVGKKDWSWNRSIWMPKEVITNIKGRQMVWVPKDT